MTVRTAADRLLAVLEAFDHRHPTLSLTEIAHRADLALATAHRLVATLTAWGALERDDSGGYHVGLRLYELAALAPRGIGLRQAAMPFLEDLYEATHENVHLAVRDGLEVVYIERLSGRSAVGVRSQVGARWPLHATGVGLALLAHGSPALQEQVCGQTLTAFTPFTVTDPERLRRMLADVRRAGCAVSDRQITDDALSVAAPVRGPRGDVVAAVSVVVPVLGAQTQALVPAVRVAARGISRTLGWQPAPGDG
ncbi:IclR family transcriptional regulator [Streptomyces sp. NBC_01262]|uniref:IclR family transcriptional regulator n=1 Tax=Streptomyces sp. NBC_01262 TaxID=2903803 RepID=UPI002E36ADAF|nr:IclR family transcriptional regulator [Streptomyces sp. NBC_01262]